MIDMQAGFCIDPFHRKFLFLGDVGRVFLEIGKFCVVVAACFSSDRKIPINPCIPDFAERFKAEGYLVVMRTVGIAVIVITAHSPNA